LPYFYLGLQEFFKYQYEEFKLSFSDQNINVRPLILTIANTSQYGNGASIAPQADYKDGMLDICIIDKLNFLDASFRLNYLFNNKIQSLSTYRSFRANRLSIKRENNSGYYHLDGEIFEGNNEFEIELLPLSLKVCI
jgi:diacylglycerol kinase family enzyme